MQLNMERYIVSVPSTTKCDHRDLVLFAMFRYDFLCTFDEASFILVDYHQLWAKGITGVS